MWLYGFTRLHLNPRSWQAPGFFLAWDEMCQADIAHATLTCRRFSILLLMQEFLSSTLRMGFIVASFFATQVTRKSSGTG